MVPPLLERSGFRTLLIAAASVLLAWLPDVLASSDRWPVAMLMGVEVQMVIVASLFLVKKNWKVALVVLLLSPVHYRFWGGAYRYARGNAHYFYESHCNGRSAQGNLDRDLRVPLICWEGRRTLPELQWALWVAPQNAAVSLCSAMFGPMPGAYDGPLPTAEDVHVLVRDSRLDVSLATVQQGSIPVDGLVVKVRPDFGPRMIEAELGRRRIPDPACLATMTARVALWRDRVLVVAMPTGVKCEGGVATAVPRDWLSFAAALDVRSGKVLGYYALGMFPNPDDLAGTWQLKTYDALY